MAKNKRDDAVAQGDKIAGLIEKLQSQSLREDAQDAAEVSEGGLPNVNESLENLRKAAEELRVKREFHDEVLYQQPKSPTETHLNQALVVSLLTIIHLQDIRSYGDPNSLPYHVGVDNPENPSSITIKRMDEKNDRIAILADKLKLININPTYLDEDAGTLEISFHEIEKIPPLLNFDAQERKKAWSRAHEGAEAKLAQDSNTAKYYANSPHHDAAITAAETFANKITRDGPEI